MAAQAGARVVCLQERRCPRTSPSPPTGRRRRERRPRSSIRTHDHVCPPAGRRDRVHVHASLYSVRMEWLARLQHRRGRCARWAPGLAYAQAAHPGHRRLLRDHYFRPVRPTGIRFPLTALPIADGSDAQLGLPDVLGPMVPGAGPRLLACGAPRCSSTRPQSAPARPSGLRHPAAVAAGDRRQRRGQRDVHGRGHRIGFEESADVLRVELHLRPLRPASRPGPAGPAAVLVADLDPHQRRDWLELFPFLSTRRPDVYSVLTAPRS